MKRFLVFVLFLSLILNSSNAYAKTSTVTLDSSKFVLTSPVDADYMLAYKISKNIERNQKYSSIVKNKT